MPTLLCPDSESTGFTLPTPPVSADAAEAASGGDERASHSERSAELTDRRLWEPVRSLWAPEGLGPSEGAHTCAPIVWRHRTIISLEEKMPELSLEDKETLDRAESQEESGATEAS